MRADAETNQGRQDDKDEKEGSNVFVAPVWFHHPTHVIFAG
jgi:hypothetical protein